MLLGSRRKIKHGMEGQSYTVVLLFYREMREAPPDEPALKQSPERSEGVSHADTCMCDSPVKVRPTAKARGQWLAQSFPAKLYSS